MPKSETVNIVLVGSGFGTKQNALWLEKAKWVTKKFAEFPPLAAERIPQLNIYHLAKAVANDNGKKCWFGCQGIDRLLCCDDSFFERAARKHCGSGIKLHVLVIHNSLKYGGAGGRVGTSSINNMAPLIAVHELGHSLFGLADEYTYSVINIDKPRKPNCDYQGCPKWTDMIGAFPDAECVPNSCASGNWHASGKATIMRVLGGYKQPKFGSVNLRYTCCKYLLEVGSYPNYCKPYDSGNFNLKPYCQGVMWNLMTTQLWTGENVTRLSQGTEFIYVSDPVFWELVTVEGQWTCARVEDEAAAPGSYLRQDVEGDEPLIKGGRVIVEVRRQGVMLRSLSFNELAAVSIPLRASKEEEEETANETVAEPEPRMGITVILNKGEICEVAALI